MFYLEQMLIFMDEVSATPFKVTIQVQHKCLQWSFLSTAYKVAIKVWSKMASRQIATQPEHLQRNYVKFLSYFIFNSNINNFFKSNLKPFLQPLLMGNSQWAITFRIYVSAIEMNSSIFFFSNYSVLWYSAILGYLWVILLFLSFCL